jgi:hypothetical protein
MMLNNMALEYITQLESTDGLERRQSTSGVIEDLEDLGFLFSSTPHGSVATL